METETESQKPKAVTSSGHLTNRKTHFMKASLFDIIKAIGANPQVVRANPQVLAFLIRYMQKFTPQKVGGKVVLHSHLPPLNSLAYKRFVDEHLLQKSRGPSHAQIGITNACKQHCSYCYNKGRSGTPMDTSTIIDIGKKLIDMGIFWLGFTGGEPLLNPDLVKITKSLGDRCILKCFSTGMGLTTALASELRDAGLYYFSISLDHYQETVHDNIRAYNGAYKAALQAIEILKKLGNVHVSVSAVFSKEMVENRELMRFIRFVESLDIHELWLSENKPAVVSLCRTDSIITPQQRRSLVAFQDQYNKTGKMTLNYLNHFEGKEHFGCNAGHKMVYIDAFGRVSPCVFIPMSFGNVRDQSIDKIFYNMKTRFPSEDCCFINKNYERIAKTDHSLPLGPQQSLDLLKNIQFGPYGAFFKAFYGKKKETRE